MRALHHYEEIGLLVPSARTISGYRLYGQADLERLQQILFYRELGFSLASIAALLDDPKANAMAHLTYQRQLLSERIERLEAKVRDVYDAGDGLLLMVASDRISAYDVVMAEPVPNKGRVLTAFTDYWLAELADIAPSHLVTVDPAEFPDSVAERGIIIADTKFELGLIDDHLSICDEVLTPDSSRFWPADAWRPGTTPPAYDKQPLRDWLEATGWDKSPPPPALPTDVVAETSTRYRSAYEIITGRKLANWHGVTG